MQTALRQLFLDFLSAIVFLIIYSLTDDLYLATGLAIAVSVVQVTVAKVRGQRVEPMQWLVLGLVLVLCAATLISHDSRFIMIKPSLVHCAIGIVMLRPGWMGRYLPKVATESLSQRFITNAGYCWAALMFALALANVVVATSFDFRVWAWFVSVGLIGAKLVAFLVQYVVMRTTIMKKRRAAVSQTV